MSKSLFKKICDLAGLGKPSISAHFNLKEYCIHMYCSLYRYHFVAKSTSYLNAAGL